MNVKTLKVEPGDMVIITIDKDCNGKYIREVQKYFEAVYPNNVVLVNTPNLITDISVIQYQGGGQLDDYLC